MTVASPPDSPEWLDIAPSLLDPLRMLRAWELALERPELARGCSVLAGASVADHETLLDLPLDTVGILAARCHVHTFGPMVDGVSTCSACGTTLDIALSLHDVLDEAAKRPAVATRQVALAAGSVSVRPPTPRDLLHAGQDDDPRAVILARCGRTADGSALDAGELSSDDLDVLDETMEDLAGAGFVTLHATCPACDTALKPALDPAALLAERVAVAAPVLLRDVVRLARAFGWSEADVLSLSPARRRAYLEMAD